MNYNQTLKNLAGIFSQCYFKKVKAFEKKIKETFIESHFNIELFLCLIAF